MPLEEGKPIWVESLLTPEEHAECHKLYPNTVKSKYPIQYNEKYHAGGTWRKGMGANLTEEEIKLTNKRIDAVLKKAGINR